MKNIWYLRKYICIQWDIFVFNENLFIVNKKYIISKKIYFYSTKLYLYSIQNICIQWKKFSLYNFIL